MDPTAQTNSTSAPIHVPTPAPKKRRVIVLEPAEAGPDVKPVRQKKPLTEAQKAALQRGRERLAERRKQLKEGHEEQQNTKEEVVIEDSDSSDSDESSTSSSDEEQNETTDEYDEAQTTSYCSLM